VDNECVDDGLKANFVKEELADSAFMLPSLALLPASLIE
jgi:hypothetical protein